MGYCRADMREFAWEKLIRQGLNAATTAGSEVTELPIDFSRVQRILESLKNGTRVASNC